LASIGTSLNVSLYWSAAGTTTAPGLVTEELIADAARRVLELGWCLPGQRIGITAGLASGKPGSTSLFQVQQL
jgi:pyruvate kinase